MMDSILRVSVLVFSPLKRCVADSLEKTLMLGKIEGRRRRGSRRLDGWISEHEFVQTQGDGEGQGSLACCSPWSRKESDTT